jgi:hypothetical protein
MELVKKNKAAEIFGHTYNGKNMFPIGCSYGDLIPDQPRYDSASYDLCDEGIKFYSPRIYGFDVIGRFELDLFDQEYPYENINIISNTLETDDMDDFIKAMFSTTSAELDEQLRNRDEFLSSQYYSLLLHHIVTSSKAKYISYGMVHNNSMVCCYVFISTDTIFDQCLLVAPGLIGSTYETGLLCEQNDDGMMNRLGSTINMAKGTIDTIDCISQPESIIIRF